jgi:hypothetical protein
VSVDITLEAPDKDVAQVEADNMVRSGAIMRQIRAGQTLDPTTSWKVVSVLPVMDRSQGPNRIPREPIAYVRCHNCGDEIPRFGSFCPFCGVDKPDDESEGKRVG